MLGCSRRVGGRPFKAQLPRSLQGLPTPPLRRRWGDLKHLTAEDKEEVLHGAWRQATPVRLVPDPSLRSGDGCGEAVAFPSDEAAQEFLQQEDAAEAAESKESTLALARRYFVELAATADEEMDAGQVPPHPQTDEGRRREMRDVQREFFADFYVEQAVITASERYAFIDTMLRPSRPLFLVNSLLPLVRLTVRDQLESHCGASSSFRDKAKEVEGRDALDIHCTSSGASSPPRLVPPILIPSPLDSCLYAIPMPPTQAIGAPLHTPYSAETSLLPPLCSTTDAAAALDSRWGEEEKEIPPPVEENGGTCPEVQMQRDDPITDAALLGEMMQETFVEADARALRSPPAVPKEVGSSAVGSQCKTETTASRQPSLSSCVRTDSGVAVRPLEVRPPGLGHTYWLQRQIASDALLNVDDVSLVLSLLSVRLAAAHSNDCREGITQRGYEVVLYQSQDRTEYLCTYYSEIAQYLFRAMQEEPPSSTAASQLARVVVVVEDPSVGLADLNSAKRSPEGKRNHRSPERLPSTSVQLRDLSRIPVSDRYPNLIYVQPARRPTPPKHRHTSVASPREAPKTSSSAQPTGVDGVVSPKQTRTLPIPFARVVVCAPSTSQDGIRPRGWLASGEADAMNEEGDIEAVKVGSLHSRSVSRSSAALPAPNNFVERCQQASMNFSRLQRRLYRAIRSVRLDGDERGGWVIYVTQSANVIEDEAVVCSVLHRLQVEKGLADDRKMSTAELRAEHGERPGDYCPPPQVECVPLDSPNLHRIIASTSACAALSMMVREGHPGLHSWVAIAEGSPAQEAEQYNPELRMAVARSAWRTCPMKTGSDGGFVICLRVTPAAPLLLPDRPGHHGGECADAAASSQLGPCWWTDPTTRIVSALSRAALEFVMDARSQERDSCMSTQTVARVIHAGFPVGFSSASPSEESASWRRTELVPDACLFSSATCQEPILNALSTVLPRLTVSARCMCELLLLKTIRSTSLRRYLHIHAKQSQAAQPQLRPTCDGAASPCAEARCFISSLEKCVEAYHTVVTSGTQLVVKERGRFHVWVGTDPASFISSPGEASRQANDEEVLAGGQSALHPAVVEELRSAGVVAEVEYTRHSFPKSSPSHIDFIIRMGVPLDMPERQKHVAALEEWRVALRDALVYVLRRTGSAGGDGARLWGPSFGDVPTVRNGYARNLREEQASSTLSTDGDTVELLHDEYETLEDPRLAPSSPFDAELSQDNRRLNSALSGEDAVEGADWIRDTNYRDYSRRRRQT